MKDSKSMTLKSITSLLLMFVLGTNMTVFSKTPNVPQPSEPIGASLTQQELQESMTDLIERSLQRAKEQSLMLAKTLETQEGKLPRTFEDGELKTVNYHSWVSGFLPGVLWLLYENSGDEQLKQYAQMMTDRVEPAKVMTNTHDLGFMLFCSFGQGYRLTQNPHYLEVIAEGTQSLLTRYNPNIGVIKSWDSNRRWQYPVIIDNMMNLEMLCFMSEAENDSRYIDIARRHADTTMKNHFRDDYSTFHVVSYDTITGEPHAKNTCQGYDDSSSWARGQAWGLYGYTMMYRKTHDKKYLNQAKNIASFLMNHASMPEDKVPYWDYDTPGQPNAFRDTSAAAIMASALIELSQLDNSEIAPEYLAFAQDQLRSLSSSAYQAGKGELGGFILNHSVGALPGNAEVDVPLSYADYYYVEALVRLKNLLNLNK